MTQLDLFGEAKAHQADLKQKREASRREVSTSAESHSEVQSRVAGFQSLFLSRLEELKHATANEVAQGDESVRKRAKELVDLGLIEVSGKRKCTVSGKTCQTYRLL